MAKRSAKSSPPWKDGDPITVATLEWCLDRLPLRWRERHWVARFIFRSTNGLNWSLPRPKRRKT